MRKKPERLNSLTCVIQKGWRRGMNERRQAGSEVSTQNHRQIWEVGLFDVCTRRRWKRDCENQFTCQFTAFTKNPDQSHRVLYHRLGSPGYSAHSSPQANTGTPRPRGKFGGFWQQSLGSLKDKTPVWGYTLPEICHLLTCQCITGFGVANVHMLLDERRGQAESHSQD